MSIDITVIVNAHSEGMLAHPACISVERARRDAEKHGLLTEVIAMLDRPSPATAEFFAERAPSDWRLASSDFGDVGRARNEAVRLARGRWIAFLDADDMFGVNWLSAACAAAEADPRQVVWHPEVNVYFGIDQHLFRHLDMESADFRLLDLICNNPWTALCFAAKSFLEANPYQGSSIASQLGYEDWSWNMEAIEKGALHKVVPGTGHLIRRRAGSLVGQTSSRKSIPIPTSLFRNILARRENVIAKADES